MIHSEEALFHAALDLGVKGYVLKDSTADDIVTAIKTIVRRHYFTRLPMTDYLLAHSESRSTLEKPHRDFLDKLTPTELRILKMLANFYVSRLAAPA
jgi:DNA-binding NarL/FixJ family response regulator